MLKLGTLAGHWARKPAVGGGGGGSSAITYIHSTTSMEKFDHATETWASATNATGPTNYGASKMEPIAVGSSTAMIVKSSNVTSSTSSCIKYSYAAETTASGGTFSTHRRGDAGLQNSTTGYFMGGQQGNFSTAATEVQKYLFSADTISAGSALGTGRVAAAGIGTSSVGICAGGANSNTTFAAIASSEKYTYGTDTRSAGTALGTARATHGAVGDTTRGIFGGGNTRSDIDGTRIATTEKYTYSGDVRVAGTTLGTAKNGPAGGGDNTFGIFAGGNSTGSSSDTTTQKYTFSSDAVASTGALGTGKAYVPAKCTTPGGL